MMKKHAISILFSAFFVAQAAYAGGKGNNSMWVLPRDILYPSNQISFNQGSNDVWYFMESTSLMHDPVTYQFLPKYSASCPLFPAPLNGLACWWDIVEQTNPFAAYPHIAINFNDQDIDDPVRGLWPAHTLLLHPQHTRLAIIGWRSPKNQKVNIKGLISSLYPTIPCGDGVRWSIEIGTNVLTSGDTNEASNDGAFSVRNLKVRSGEVVYFIGDPKGNDFCDSTKVSIRITSNSRSSEDAAKIQYK